jgi:hypothetical protein
MILLLLLLLLLNKFLSYSFAQKNLGSTCSSLVAGNQTSVGLAIIHLVAMVI